VQPQIRLADVAIRVGAAGDAVIGEQTVRDGQRNQQRDDPSGCEEMEKKNCRGLCV
jgi:hypothetical protein